MDLTEAEGIKKRGQEYTIELHKKDLNDSDNYECVSYTQSQTSWNVKSSGHQEDSLRTKLVELEFQLGYFKPLKIMLLKCFTQYASKSGKLSSGHRTGKGQFSFRSPRKAMPKNTQTTTQLNSSHTLAN